jgi:uncharacterized membrane protein
VNNQLFLNSLSYQKESKGSSMKIIFAPFLFLIGVALIPFFAAIFGFTVLTIGVLIEFILNNFFWIISLFIVCSSFYLLRNHIHKLYTKINLTSDEKILKYEEEQFKLLSLIENNHGSSFDKLELQDQIFKLEKLKEKCVNKKL